MKAGKSEGAVVRKSSDVPKSKKSVSGVGQLSLTFGEFTFPKDAAQETQENEDATVGGEATGITSALAHPSENAPTTSIEPAAIRSKPERKRKWHSLIDKVYAPPNLVRAFEKVRDNNGAAGPDGVTVAQFSEKAERYLTELHIDLRDKRYRPGPVRRVFIPKSGGGQRPLGIPSVRDRIVQQALLQILEPVFEPTFSVRSHGFRPSRGCATALKVVDQAIRVGYTHVVDADIQSFFDTVDHEKLIDAIYSEVSDSRVLKLIRQILTAGVSMPNTREVEPTSLGTPQGGPLSPLLANIYLDRLDKRLVSAGYGLVRYADDFVIFTKSEEEAHAALSLSQQVLSGELGLVLHPEKTRVMSVDTGFEFLGFHYFRDPKSGVRCKEVRRKSVQRFRDAIRERTPRLKTQRPVKVRHLTFSRLQKNERLAYMVARLNNFLTGWHWYFKPMQSRYKSGFGTFDGFVRRRVRSAIVGRPGSGYWNAKLPTALLSRLGLLSLVDMQTKYQLGLLSAPTRRG